MGTQTSVIQTIDVCKSLPMGGQQLEILSKVSIDIQRAEMVAVVGPSGSGKSTLMGLIGGLDSPTSGQVIIDGVDITHLNERALTRMRNEKIGFVFQDYNLVPTLDALENVMLPMQFSRNRRSGAKQRAQDLLAMLGLDKRLHHSYKQLSGGEQQRVVIARALANQPPILLCDEPTGNLDRASTALVIEALFEIREAMGTTIVMVTHNPALADLLDRKIVLVDGKIDEQRQ